MQKRTHLRLWLAVVLIFCLTLGAPIAAYGEENDVLAEVRTLLQNNYVDIVPEDVLNAPTVQEMIKKLGDRNTQYMAKAEYDQFLNSLNMSFSGVGIELDMVAQGVLVTRVIDGYGAAKAGILAGDIITNADGNSFAGKTSEYCVGKLRGPEGTSVAVKVKRGTKTLNFTLKRMTIVLPLVESKVLENHIGYLSIHSFGTETAAQFGKQALALSDQGVDSWIIDLRNNGGGYTQAAFELLGYFIGNGNAVILKDRSPLAIVYPAVEQAFTLEGPIVLLTNGYTGSASEIVTAAIKDHEKATIIGETTYGSGRVKALLPLSNGDFLKTSIDRFFSPNYNPIDEVGIKPQMDLSGVDELMTAVLMLKDYNQEVSQKDAGDKTGYLQLNAGPNNYAISLVNLRKSENWVVGNKILDSAYVTTTLKLGGVNGWEPFPEVYLQDRSKIYYPGYITAGVLKNIPLDKVFTVKFNSDINAKSVTTDSIELINAATGERMKYKLAFTDARSLTVTPQSKLKANTEYWLVIHPTILDGQGKAISGGVAISKTVK